MKKLLSVLTIGAFLLAGVPALANQNVANENASEQGQKMSREKAGDKAQKGKKDKKGKKGKKGKDQKKKGAKAAQTDKAAQPTDQATY